MEKYVKINTKEEIMKQGGKLALMIIGVIALVAPITFGLTVWLWQGNDNETLGNAPNPVDAALRAIPVRATNVNADMDARAMSAFDFDLDVGYDEPVIRDYFVDYTTNRSHFLIDVGYIKDAFIETVGGVHYVGAPATISISEVSEVAITSSMTRAVSNSVTVSQSHTFTASVQAGPSVFRTTATWAGNVANANTLASSFTYGHAAVERLARTITTTYTISGKEHGWYRLAIYSKVDMFFVVETSADNQTLYSWDMVAFPVGDPFYRLEFCVGYQARRPIFDNTPLSTAPLIDFAPHFYRNLPLVERTQEPTPNPRNGTFIFSSPTLAMFSTLHVAGQITVLDGEITNSAFVSDANLQWGNQITAPLSGIFGGTSRLVSYTSTNTVRVWRNSSGGTEVVRVQISFLFIGNQMMAGGIALLRSSNNSTFLEGSLTIARLSY